LACRDGGYDICGDHSYTLLCPEIWNPKSLLLICSCYFDMVLIYCLHWHLQHRKIWYNCLPSFLPQIYLWILQKKFKAGLDFTWRNSSVYNRYTVCFQLCENFIKKLPKRGFIAYVRWVPCRNWSYVCRLGSFFCSLNSGIGHGSICTINSNLRLHLKGMYASSLTCRWSGCFYWNSVPCFNLRICGPSCISQEVSRKRVRYVLQIHSK